MALHQNWAPALHGNSCYGPIVGAVLVAAGAELAFEPSHPSRGDADLAFAEWFWSEKDF